MISLWGVKINKHTFSLQVIVTLVVVVENMKCERIHRSTWDSNLSPGSFFLDILFSSLQIIQHIKVCQLRKWHGKLIFVINLFASNFCIYSIWSEATGYRKYTFLLFFPPKFSSFTHYKKLMYQGKNSSLLLIS